MPGFRHLRREPAAAGSRLSVDRTFGHRVAPAPLTSGAVAAEQAFLRSNNQDDSALRPPSASSIQMFAQTILVVAARAAQGGHALLIQGCPGTLSKRGSGGIATGGYSAKGGRRIGPPMPKLFVTGRM
jgi:hypothetical protein